MSHRAMEAAILSDAPTASAKSVMMALAYCHNQENDRCFPGRARIAELSGLTERTIYDAIKALVDAKLIRVFERRRGRDNLRTSDGYLLDFAEPENLKRLIIRDRERVYARHKEAMSPEDFAKYEAEVTGNIRQLEEEGHRQSTQKSPANGAREQGRGTGKVVEDKKASPKKADPSIQPVLAFHRMLPQITRKRSTSAEVEAAMVAAIGRGAKPEAILEGLRAYYADEQQTREDGRYAKALHRMIQGDRWRDHAPAPQSSDPIGQQPTDDLAAEMIRRQARNRMDEWIKYSPDPIDRAAYWRTAWGPNPTEPGCTIPPDILAEYAGR